MASSSVATEPPVWARLWRALRKYRWADERLAATAKQGFGPGCPGWYEFDLGSTAARAAKALGESRELESAALLLHRSAAALLAQAHLRRAGVAPSAPTSADPDARSARGLPGQAQSCEEHSLDRVVPVRNTVSLRDPESGFELGCQAVRAAEKLEASGGPERIAALLHRSAAVLFVRAHLAQPGGGLMPPALSNEDWDRLQKLPSGARVIASQTPDHFDLATACLGADGESHLSTLTHGKRRRAARVLAQFARELAAPLESEARVVQRLVFKRRLTVGISAALGVALVVYGAFASGFFEKHNLALHRSVTMSSVFAANIGRNPALLVDGDTSNLGFHTARAANQYVTIDLGSVQRVRKVVVHNRVDCCEDRAVPLLIEVSRDGRTYLQVATRTTTFNVWKATFSPVDARYVKLARPKPDYFHLSEVEVY